MGGVVSVVLVLLILFLMVCNHITCTMRIRALNVIHDEAIRLISTGEYTKVRNIYVDGFKFHDAHSCRLTTAKALAWARDVCNTAVHADSLVPGGVIVAVADLPDEAKKALES